MEWLSGAQNTDHAPSVPGTGVHLWRGQVAYPDVRAVCAVAVKASRLPSGEMAKD